ncbi:MAG TPA: AAA family ATPase [Opitutaceae bacterium]
MRISLRDNYLYQEAAKSLGPQPKPITVESLAEAAGELPPLMRSMREKVTDSANRMPVPQARSLMELSTTPPQGAELLRDRLLFRKEGAIVMGGTGGGKSTLSIGCGMSWACGREYLGIRPTGPLKILIVEAEDCEWTNGFMRDGAMSEMTDLDEDELELIRMNCLVCEERQHVGIDFFHKVLRPLTEQHHPDLVFINPAFSYLGGDSNSAEDVAEFLRTNLNPLLEEYNCGAIVFHHTNKLPGIESERMKEFNPAYAASGHNEWNNWPRVGLTLMPTRNPDISCLIATKRPKAAGWVDENGARTNMCYISRSADPSKPAWTRISSVEVAAARAAVASKAGRPATIRAEDVVEQLRKSESGEVVKAELMARCETAFNVSASTAKDRIREALDRGMIQVVREEKRSGGGHKVQILGLPEAIGENVSATCENEFPADTNDQSTETRSL